MQGAVYLAQTGGQYQQQGAQPAQCYAGDGLEEMPASLLPVHCHAANAVDASLMAVLHATVFANG